MRIREIQTLALDMGAVEKVLPLLARSNDDIVRETLAFVSVMLFNANEAVQVMIVYLACYYNSY